VLGHPAGRHPSTQRKSTSMKKIATLTALALIAASGSAFQAQAHPTKAKTVAMKRPFRTG
jgi:FtsH-binding integral membrane protein